MIIEHFKRLNSYTSELRASQTSLRGTRSASSSSSVAPPSSVANGEDEVIVSPEALLFSRAKDALTGVPETRDGLIQTLQEAIQNGTYSVDNVLIAERLMEAVARFTRN